MQLHVPIKSLLHFFSKLMSTSLFVTYTGLKTSSFYSWLCFKFSRIFTQFFPYLWSIYIVFELHEIYSGFFFQIITRFLSLKKGDITLASNDWCSLTPVTVCPCISWRTRAGVAGARVTTGSLLTGTITARSNWNH